MTWTYNTAQLATSTLYQVRHLTGDVLTTDQKLADEEIALHLTLRSGNVYRAAADACRAIAARMSSQVDQSQGDLSNSYSQRARAFADRAIELEALASTVGSGAFMSLPYAGGISQADKDTAETNSDRVEPQFKIGMQDYRE